MTQEELYKKHLDKLCDDMLQEQQLRSDYSIALNYIIAKYNLFEAIENINKAVSELEFYGWYKNKLELIKELL